MYTQDIQDIRTMSYDIVITIMILSSLFQLKNIGIQTIVNFKYSRHQVNALLNHILKVNNLMEENGILLNTHVSFAEKIE